MRQRNTIVLRLQLLGDQQVVFRFEQVGATVNRELEIETVCDRVFRTRLNALTAEDATAVVDVVNAGVTYVDTDALRWRTRIVRGNYIDTFCRTRGGAEITS